MPLIRFTKRIQSIDADRYENLYSKVLREKKENNLGLFGIDESYRKPYIEYYTLLRKLISSSDRVLELGSGTGIHTNVLCDLSSNVFALDISDAALKLCHENTKGRANYIKGSIDALPFESNYFDFIVSVGTLSYSDWENLTKEILRTLKPSGSVIFLDSLNNNPIYIFNRLFHVVKRNRTLATVIQIPTSRKIIKLSKQFRSYEMKYFDQLVWLRKLGFAKYNVVNNLIDNLEKLKFLQSQAFKFVIVGLNLKK